MFQSADRISSEYCIWPTCNSNGLRKIKWGKEEWRGEASEENVYGVSDSSDVSANLILTSRSWKNRLLATWVPLSTLAVPSNQTKASVERRKIMLPTFPGNIEDVVSLFLWFMLYNNLLFDWYRRTNAWDISQIFDVGLCSLFHAIAHLVNETLSWIEAASADVLHFLCRWLVKYMHIHTDICNLLASLLRILHRFDWLCLPQTRLGIIHTSMASALAAPSVMVLS